MSVRVASYVSALTGGFWVGTQVEGETATSSSGTFDVAGRNFTARPRRRGGAACIKLSTADDHEAWCFEGIEMTVRPTGRQRLA